MHEPVLVSEIIEWLRPQDGGIHVDCTVGAGGHAGAILESADRVEVIGIDRDAGALDVAGSKLAAFGSRFRVVKGDFSNITEILDGLGITAVRGVLADLGVSSMQLDAADRGFSFSADGPLDMRMDQSAGTTAAELVNRLGEHELANLIFEYGEERASRRIARAIVREREKAPITTTGRLASIVVSALRVKGRWRIHPATRTFQALRIAVNDELGTLERFIPRAIDVLEPGGRLAVISFHSLEDRIVKRLFSRESGRCICTGPPGGRFPVPPQRQPGNGVICRNCGAARRIEVLTRKPVRPGREESARNPRSRSARLRVCQKVQDGGA